MNQSAVAFQYAKAFFDALSGEKGDREKRLENALAVLEQIHTILEQHPDFFAFLIHPQIKIQNKKRVLEKIITDNTCLSFLLFIIEKRKIALFTAITQSFRDLLLKKHNELEATLITAVPMDQRVLGELKERLDSSFHKKTKILFVIDPTIIAGALLFVGQRMIDYSIKGRLHQLKQSLMRG